LGAKGGVLWQPYWVSLPFLVALGYVLFVRRNWPWVWGGLLLAELWLLAWPLVAVRREADVYAASPCVRYLVEHNRDAGKEHGRVLDRDAAGPLALAPLGAGAPLALLFGLEPVRGYNPLDVLRFKEYLQFVGDDDGPLRPLAGCLTFPVI